jgi:hypothetical protein
VLLLLLLVLLSGDDNIVLCTLISTSYDLASAISYTQKNKTEFCHFVGSRYI